MWGPVGYGDGDGDDGDDDDDPSSPARLPPRRGALPAPRGGVVFDLGLPERFGLRRVTYSTEGEQGGDDEGEVKREKEEYELRG